MRHLFAALVFVAFQHFAVAAPVPAECTSAERTSTEPAWLKGDRHNYEEAGAGFSVAFRGRYGFGTVYVFDAGVSDWTEGLSDPRLASQLDEVIAGVRELERRGRYSEVSFASPSERNLFCHGFLVLTMSGKLDGRSVKSAAAVSVLNGKVLKFRATYFSDPPAGIEGETEALVREALAGDAVQ